LTLSACVARGVCRVATLQRFAPFADCSALDTWHSTPFPNCSVPGVSHPVLCSDMVLANQLILSNRAETQHFLPRCPRWIAPRSTPCSSHRSRITSRSTLDPPHRVRIAPYSMLPALRCLRIAPYASLSARTMHESLRARHLTFRIVPGALLADCSLHVASRPASPADRSALDA